MATNPYSLALAQRLAPGQGSVVDPRAAIAQRLMNYQAAPVTDASAGTLQALAAALSGATGSYLSGQIRADQKAERAQGLDMLRQQSDTFRADEVAKEERQRQEAQSLLASLGIGGATPPTQTAPVIPASMPMPSSPVTAEALPPATPAPMGGGGVRGDNQTAATMRDEAMRTLQGPALEARLAEISAGRAQALTGNGPDTQFRANPGVNGVFAGLPAPAPGVPTLASSPSGQPDARNAALAASLSGNPLLTRAAPVLGQMASSQEAARTRADDQAWRQGESQRAQGNADRSFRLQEEAARRSEDASRRAEEATRLAAERSGIPQGYRRTDGGGLEAIPGGPADPDQARALASSRRTGATIPPFIQKAEAEDIDAIQTASGVAADLQALRGQIDNGQLDFSLVGNIRDRAGNFVGADTENSRNLQSYRSTMTRIVNDSLRLNKGVQTEGDAQRAGAELMDNINSPGVVRQRLAELERLNQRAIQFRTATINRRRAENGLPETDLTQFTSVAPVVGNGAPQNAPSPAAPAGASPDPVIASGGGLRRVASVAEARSLPSGTRFLDPNGVERMVP